MAWYRARITTTSGAFIEVKASGATTYPDALSQIKHEVVDGVKECVAYVLAAEAVEAEDES